MIRKKLLIVTKCKNKKKNKLTKTNSKIYRVSVKVNEYIVYLHKSIYDE